MRRFYKIGKLSNPQLAQVISRSFRSGNFIRQLPIISAQRPTIPAKATLHSQTRRACCSEYKPPTASPSCWSIQKNTQSLPFTPAGAERSLASRKKPLAKCACTSAQDPLTFSPRSAPPSAAVATKSAPNWSPNSPRNLPTPKNISTNSAPAKNPIHCSGST